MKYKNENQQIEHIRHGDKAAFDELFKKYYTPLCNYILKIVHSEMVSEDVVQEVFVSLWINRDKINITKSVAQYLFSAAKFRAFTNYRQLISRQEHEFEYIDKNFEDFEENDTSLSDYEIALMIHNAMNQLPEKCREIFILSREEGYTYKEIAERLKISIKTVEGQMSTAFKKLRIILRPMLKTWTITIVSFVVTKIWW